MQFYFWEYINWDQTFILDSHRPFICSAGYSRLWYTRSKGTCYLAPMVAVPTNEAKWYMFSCSGYLCSSLPGRSLGRHPLGMSMKSYLGKLWTISVLIFLATKGQILRDFIHYILCVFKPRFLLVFLKMLVSTFWKWQGGRTKLSSKYFRSVTMAISSELANSSMYNECFA